jgi:hypothetical protein
VPAAGILVAAPLLPGQRWHLHELLQPSLIRHT